MRTWVWNAAAAILVAAALAACSGSEAPASGDAARGSGDDAAFLDDTGPGRTSDTGGGAPPTDTFRPEDEEFLVREVASTDRFVFVPDSGDQSSTVARIDGQSLGIVPIRVARKPVAVRAAEVEDIGAVAYVLSEGESAVSIIRAEKFDKHTRPEQRVSILPVPDEVNSIALAPGGRHLIAYIDPEKPLPDDASAASLQVASLIRLGDSRSNDSAFRLSVSRLVRDVEFSADGSEAFVVGRDGINRLVFDRIDSDRFIAPLDLELSDSVFPPTDREVEVAPSGDFLVVRSSQFSGIALHRPPAPDAPPEAAGDTTKVALPEPPTDIDLRTGSSGDTKVIVSMPQTRKVAIVDVPTAFGDSSNGGTTDPGVRIVDAAPATPGLAQVAPNGEDVLLYTTRETRPELGLLQLADESVETYPLRNQIRSVAVSPNSASAVVVHEKQEGPPPSDASTLEFFQHNHGLTLFDMNSGYRRPVILRGDPASLVMTRRSDGTPLLFAMLQSEERSNRGLTRLDLSTYRRDFLPLPRSPDQLGRVAGKIFVSQESDVGRITFVDVDSGERQTISGYELNARIK